MRHINEEKETLYKKTLLERKRTTTIITTTKQTGSDKTKILIKKHGQVVDTDIHKLITWGGFL